MKKLLNLLAVSGSLLALAACDDTPENPGDFSVKSDLELGQVVRSIHGDTYDLVLQEERDTTYQYPYIERDTLKDGQGKPIIGSDGNLQITETQKFYSSKITAKYRIMKPILLPAQADTFELSLTSNARWKAPVPSSGGKAQWYFNYNLLTGGTSTAGGGDGVIDFRVLRNRNKRRAVDAVQYILTSDSTVLYKLVFQQSGEKD